MMRIGRTQHLFTIIALLSAQSTARSVRGGPHKSVHNPWQSVRIYTPSVQIRVSPWRPCTVRAPFSEDPCKSVQVRASLCRSVHIRACPCTSVSSIFLKVKSSYLLTFKWVRWMDRVYAHYYTTNCDYNRQCRCMARHITSAWFSGHLPSRI